MNSIFDKHAPFKKITTYKLKSKTKPWTNTALQKFICITNKVFKNYIKQKYLSQKNECHNSNKIYRNTSLHLRRETNKIISLNILKAT